ncbi:MAG TPA: DUF2520 domain-containing protein [Terriglobia bacterium]|nr:DUF2520 domain-containing protein [Terriglobia bacterium]
MAGRPKIAIVGAGKLGTALAESLHAAGYRISEVVSREASASRRRARVLARRVSARATTMRRPELTAEIVWFCVPDRAIASQADALAKAHSAWRGKIAIHSSGALDSGELAALRARGAATASAHPLMTFVPGVRPSLAGVGFAVEGQSPAVRAARRLIAALGGRAYPIDPRQKVLYHAWGTFASPLMIALLAVTEKVAAGSGVRRARARERMAPILRQTLENYVRRGPAGAFSGPVIRGDVETVRKHLRALKGVPGAYEVYSALARAALDSLPVKNRKALMAELKG